MPDEEAPVEPTLERAWSRIEDLERSAISVAGRVRGDLGESAPSLTDLDLRTTNAQSGVNVLHRRVSVLEQPNRRDPAANTNTQPRRRSTDTPLRRRGEEFEMKAQEVAIAIGVVLAVILVVLLGGTIFEAGRNLAASGGSPQGYQPAGTANAAPMAAPPRVGPQAKPAIFDRERSPCEAGYQWYPERNACVEHHEPKFVKKAKCEVGDVKWVPDPSRPGGKREQTCGFAPQAASN